jgi:hypothetical protein
MRWSCGKKYRRADVAITDKTELPVIAAMLSKLKRRVFEVHRRRAKDMTWFQGTVTWARPMMPMAVRIALAIEQEIDHD